MSFRYDPSGAFDRVIGENWGMNLRALTTSSLLVMVLGTSLAACKKDEAKPNKDLAPTASALSVTKPASKAATTFAVETSSSKVDFLMDAVNEKIHGKVLGAMSGDLFVDTKDLTKTTGLVKVDLDKLELTQQKRASEKEKFPEEEKKDPKQNEHARAWLEIDEKNANHEKNRFIEYKIEKVETDTKDVDSMSGDSRKVKLKVTGSFRLHQRVEKKTAEIEATFTYKDGKPVSVKVVTVKPFAVGLKEFDVHPRDKVGSLLTKGLNALGKKVAKEAMITMDYEAKMK
jgi:hypothetical protein